MEGAPVIKEPQTMENNTGATREVFPGADEISVSTTTAGGKILGALRRFWTWLRLSGKRLLKKPTFVIIVLMLPAVLLLYRVLITEDDGKLHVAVYFEEKDDLAAEYLRVLQQDVPEEFLYYVCDSEEDLYSDVAAGRAECGYVFSADMGGKILTDDWKGMITAVVSERTVYGGFVNEITYVKLLRIIGGELSVDYLVRRSGVEISREEAEQRIRKIYAEKEPKMDLVEYAYINSETGDIVSAEEAGEPVSVLTKPIRGTVAIFILLTALAGLVFWYQDDAEGRFRVMARERRPLISFASLLLPTAMASLVGLVCLAVSGLWTTTWRELTTMFLYMLLCTCFANILRFLIPSVHAVCAMIPIFVLISYLGCPILLDIALYMPSIRFLRYAMAPQYYLRVYEGLSAGLLAAATAVLMAISVVLALPERNR